MTRYLAIDPGGKRTGLAVGDDELGQVGPVGTIEAGDDEHLITRLVQAVEEYAPDALVIGMPLNMDGSIGPAAARIGQLAAHLHERTGLTVHTMDERLSSYAADQQMAGRDLTRKGKKQRRDTLAATIILRDFLNQSD